MAFEQFPYTNFHDLNLDWIITQMNDWASQWAEVKAAYDTFSADFSAVIAAIEALQEKDVELELSAQSLNAKYATLASRTLALETSLTTLSNTVSSNYSDLNSRMLAIETNATFYMYSPFTGQYVPITTVIQELAQYHLEDALTAAEYDALDLTAAAYDAYELTAIQYDASGKTLL